MTPEQWTASIVAVIAAGMPGFLAWLQTRRTHTAINSRMDELLKIAKAQARGEGRAEGVASEKADQALKAQGAMSEADKTKDK